MTRKAKINRKTKETNIAVEANLDGKGTYKIDTKIGQACNKKNIFKTTKINFFKEFKI